MKYSRGLAPAWPQSRANAGKLAWLSVPGLLLAGGAAAVCGWKMGKPARQAGFVSPGCRLQRGASNYGERLGRSP